MAKMESFVEYKLKTGVRVGYHDYKSHEFKGDFVIIDCESYDSEGYFKPFRAILDVKDLEYLKIEHLHLFDDYE